MFSDFGRNEALNFSKCYEADLVNVSISSHALWEVIGEKAMLLVFQPTADL